MTDLKELEIRVARLEVRLLDLARIMERMHEIERTQTKIIQQLLDELDELESEKSVVALDKDC